MFMQSRIPVLYSGDEIGQINDSTYKKDPHKAADSRYIHRGAMRWKLAERIRREEKAFVAHADTWTIETGDKELLCIGRYFEGDQILGIFNFSEHDKKARINVAEEEYVGLLTGREKTILGIHIPAYEFYYLKRK